MNKMFHGGEKFLGGKGLRWRKMKTREAAGPEALLREREPWCVSACGRYLSRNPSTDHMWTLRDTTGNLSALIFHAKRNLMPVLCGKKDIPVPRFLKGFFSIAPIHAVQGLTGEVVTLVKALEQLGLWAAENIDFDLMSIDRSPNESCFHSGPAGLIIRKPQYTDLDALAVLQAGYEQEEVLPQGAEFNRAVSRYNTERILAHEQVLSAELGGRLVGKINTSAVSFTRFQIGGVYVHPDFRGLGIARRMAAEFVRSLVAQGRGITLFVKKSNFVARIVYKHLGFETLGDYRISYY